MRKALDTIRLTLTLALARTFGQYIHSGWNGEFEYARYRWRGKEWVIPTAPCNSNE